MHERVVERSAVAHRTGLVLALVAMTVAIFGSFWLLLILAITWMGTP